MKILLIDIPLSDVNNIFSTVHKEILFPSLGLYYLKEYAYSNDNTLSIEILDLSDKDFVSAVNETIEKKPDIIGISCFTDRRSLVLNFIKEIKKNRPEIISVIGGAHASAMSEQIMKNYSFIDFIVNGEGEKTFYELISSIKNNSADYSHIEGLSYRKNNSVIHNKTVTPVHNLDNIPYPKFNILPQSIKFTHYDGRFLFNGKNISELKTMSVITSRGCPFKCTYCSTTAFWGRNVRYRSPENVVEEIEYLNRNHDVEFINFVDDAFTINKKRVIEICNLILKKNIKICWICETNVKTIDEEMIILMKKSGCFAINFGVESGSPAILKNIKKNITGNEIINALNLCRKHSVIPDIFLMVGNPGETSETVKETIKILKKAHPNSGGWGILTIFPGTELYDECRKNNYISDNYWLSEHSSPYYLEEHSYLEQRIFLNRIKCFFLFKNRKYRLWLRYKLLEFRDYIFNITGIKLSFKKKFEYLPDDKSRIKPFKY